MRDNYYSQVVFSQVLADKIIADFRPQKALTDCESLIASLIERGIDTASFSLDDIRTINNKAQRYDIVITQGLLEQLDLDEKRTVIKNLCSYSDTILLIYSSVTPPQSFGLVFLRKIIFMM